MASFASIYRFRWLGFFGALALLGTVPCAYCAGVSSAKTWEKYEKEIELLHKQLTMTPLTLTKTKVGPGEGIVVSCSLVNETKAELIPPQAPAGDDTALGKASQISAERRACHVAWGLRRKDGRAPGSTYKGTLGAGWVQFVSLRPGERHELSQVVDVDKLNLISGECEVVMICYAPTGGKTLFTRTAVFTVDNPKALTPAQIAQKAKTEAEQALTAVKKLASGLRVGELTLSNANVTKGANLIAGCQLSNATAADIELPAEIAHRVLIEQWYVTKVPAGRRRDPYGGAMIAMPSGNSFGAGRVVELNRTITTLELEPGAYEVTLEVKTFPESVIALRKQRFKVVK